MDASTDSGGSSAGDDDKDDGALLAPIPAAPLFAALPNLRHCQLMFVRFQWEIDLEGTLSSLSHCRVAPMLLATPAELAALRAPRLESLAVGLVAAHDPAFPSGAADIAGAPGGAAGSSLDSGLPALRSLELNVGCSVEGGPSRGHAALPAGLLPALRRLMLLPLCFDRHSARLPLSAVARAAPALEQLVVDRRCAGPLDALFCEDGCAHALRRLAVLPPLRNASAPALIDAELHAGLLQRAAMAGANGAGHALPRIKVRLYSESQPSDDAPEPCPPGTEIARRRFADYDSMYIACVLSATLLRRVRIVTIMDHVFDVDAYERVRAA